MLSTGTALGVPLPNRRALGMLPLVIAACSNPRNIDPGGCGFAAPLLWVVQEGDSLPCWVPAGRGAGWGTQKVLPMGERSWGEAELGVRFRSCEGCSVSPLGFPSPEAAR